MEGEQREGRADAGQEGGCRHLATPISGNKMYNVLSLKIRLNMVKQL